MYQSVDKHQACAHSLSVLKSVCVQSGHEVDTSEDCGHKHQACAQVCLCAEWTRVKTVDTSTRPVLTLYLCSSLSVCRVDTSEDCGHKHQACAQVCLCAEWTRVKTVDTSTRVDTSEDCGHKHQGCAHSLSVLKSPMYVLG
ncbi:hypothetical protein WMY93_021360 [Mugilogobius chulae]|uniref:Uncharacterized protein n=1 Tax=Mugilogobius chulae TaxID=88201 RepID=A0AAW0NDM6_9GOBI